MAAPGQINGQARTSFELVLPDQLPVPLTPGMITYTGSAMMEDVFGKKEYIHKFSTLLPEFVNSMIRSAMATNTPRLRFRLGFGQPNNIFWLPWQECFIVHYSGILEGISQQSGHTLELTTSDAFFSVGRIQRTGAHKGTLSSMVEAIAARNDLEAVVEPTTGEYLFIQSYEDDIAFMRERLLPRAINAKGRGNYFLFMLDNVLHFHSADYQSTVVTVPYYEQPAGQLIQTDRSQQLWEQGVSGTHLIVYDPYTGQTKAINNSPDQVLRYAKGIYNLSQLASSQRNILYHLSANQPDEATALGQNTYEHARWNTFEVTLTLDQTINLRIGNIINLLLTQQTDKTSPWSGLYLLAGMMYTITQNAVTVKLTLRRGETQPDTNTISVQAPQLQLVPQEQAPGQDVNVSVTQNSILTRGAGIQSGNSTFATVIDANTA